MKSVNRSLRLLCLAIFSLSICFLPAFATDIVIVNQDGANEGFNDTNSVAPVGGNTGTTIGQQRLNVFNTAAEVWECKLTSSVPILVGSNFDPLFCNETSATLGSAGPITVFRDFTGAPVANTWYVSSLANAILSKMRGVWRWERRDESMRRSSRRRWH